MSLTNNKRIVELWGLPGVGKTTLTKELAADSGYTFISARTMSFQKIRLWYVYPVTVCAWMPAIFKCYRATKSFKLFRYNLALFFSALQRHYDAERQATGRVVIDEGLLQRILSLSDVVFKKSEIERLIDHSPIGDKIILVNHRDAEFGRYNDNHFRNSFGETYLETWKTNMRQNEKVLAEVLRERFEKRYDETTHEGVIEKLKQSNE